MSELLSIVSLVGFLVGQIQIVTLAIKGKKFSFTKNAFVIAYLLIGINIYLNWILNNFNKIPEEYSFIELVI
jgi:cytochrome b subunit of formate dehydrogenase